MKTFFCALALWLPLCGSALAVDLNGAYVGADGVITIMRGASPSSFFVDIADRNEVCGMAMEMRLVKNRLVSDEAPLALRFTRKGIVLEMPREELGEECKNFALDKPFKRQQ